MGCDGQDDCLFVLAMGLSDHIRIYFLSQLRKPRNHTLARRKPRKIPRHKQLLWQRLKVTEPENEVEEPESA